MDPIDAAAFEALVGDELDRLPEWLADAVDNVVVMVEGRIVKRLNGAEVTRAAIVAASYDNRETA